MSKKLNFVLLAGVIVAAVFLAKPFFLLVNGFSFSEIQRLQKIEQVMQVANNYYIEKVDWETGSENAIEGFLSGLDPHSVYINSEQANQNDELFEGKYQGIGIQFDIIDGYVNVISVIPGSPAQDAGILAGDRIIKIEGKSAEGITAQQVQRRLKGPKGSKVKVTVERPGVDEPIAVEFTRDEVPNYTVNTYFMANDSTGYVWLNRFASTTADELENALIQLERKGMKQLLLDLRNNGGGFLQQAVKVTGKFLKGRKKVVYTKGRLEQVEEEYYSDDFGKSIDRPLPLVILINGASASASEIVAGALQDYDRALIAGERSFGKGLVQNEFVLSDNSRIRLTVSRYYTPSGRLIQKPYKDRSVEDYYNGDEQDSLATQTDKIFRTVAGRPVYGGGGIEPDTTIFYDAASLRPRLTQKLFEERVFFESATLTGRDKPDLRDNKDWFVNNYKIRRSHLEQLSEIARNRGVLFEEEDFWADSLYIANRLKAEIARHLWSQKEFWRVLLQYDNQFDKALQLFPQARMMATTAEK